MWFSQLAYEGAKGATIEAVRQTWNFASIFSFNIPKIDVVASFDTMGIVGERADAIVLAFAGTDPAVWETLATDFNINSHRTWIRILAFRPQPTQRDRRSFAQSR